MAFDEKLRSLRTKHDMTQQYVAKKLNVARSTIAGYETKNRQPSHEKLTALAGLFHVSVDYLLDGENTITMTIAPPLTNQNVSLELLEKYENLSLESRKDLLSYIHLLELRDQEQRCLLQ